MNVCEHHAKDVFVLHESYNCPLCAAEKRIEVLEKIELDQDNEIANLQEEINAIDARQTGHV